MQDIASLFNFIRALTNSEEQQITLLTSHFNLMAIRRLSNNAVYLTIFILIVIIAIILWYRARRSSNKDEPTTTQHKNEMQATAKIDALEIPEPIEGNEVVQHKAYTLSFNPQYKIASWVAYLQTGKHSQNATEVRTNNFTDDPLLHSSEARDEDYNHSGYDRGHLAPAEDMAWSKETMQESFYYSNMVPQDPKFNRGVWRRLEELVRYWSLAYDSIYIVTGPVFTQSMSTIGSDKIAVPEKFYKVILEYNQKEARGIGFILSNQPSAATLQSFAVSIDSVEHLTGINFFPRLDDTVEEKIESNPRADEWLWKKRKNN